MAKLKRSIKRGRLPSPKRQLRLEKLIPSVVELVKSIRPIGRLKLPEVTKPGLFLRQKIKAERYPIIGIRSQRERRKDIKHGYKTINNLTRYFRDTNKLTQNQRICRARNTRRITLFSKGIAGYNKTRSPGHFGRYKYTSDSEKSCRRA